MAVITPFLDVFRSSSSKVFTNESTNSPLSPRNFRSGSRMKVDVHHFTKTSLIKRPSTIQDFKKKERRQFEAQIEIELKVTNLIITQHFEAKYLINDIVTCAPVRRYIGKKKENAHMSTYKQYTFIYICVNTLLCILIDSILTHKW